MSLREHQNLQVVAPGPRERCSTIPAVAGQRSCTSAQTGGSRAPSPLLLKLQEIKDSLGRIKGSSVPSAASFPKTLSTYYKTEQLTEKQTWGLGGRSQQGDEDARPAHLRSSNMPNQCQGSSSCISPPRLFFSRKMRCKIIHVGTIPCLQSSSIFYGMVCTQCP